MREWNHNAIDAAGPSQLAEDSLFRSQSLGHVRTPKAQRHHKPPENIRRAAVLPGFQNSFVTSTPVRLFRNKGKAKASESFVSQKHLLTGSFPPPISPPSSPTRYRRDMDSDIRMEDVQNDDNDETEKTNQIAKDGDVEISEEDDATVGELEIIEPPNWKAEVPKTLFLASINLTGVAVPALQNHFNPLFVLIPTTNVPGPFSSAPTFGICGELFCSMFPTSWNPCKHFPSQRLRACGKQRLSVPGCNDANTECR